ncbi:hypothetical protein KDA00_02880 [Candidatus Saccharibacteria bacterium]|nr:hypothetical protein [Candidatus Saccharibacteria bacterium]
MLEFIVLGKVPGTDLVLTFNWLLLIVAGSLLFYDIKHVINRQKTERQNIKNA